VIDCAHSAIIERPVRIPKMSRFGRNATMLGFPAGWLLLLLFSLLVALASCQDESTTVDPKAVVPFFVRSDEGGELVVVVVYGPRDYEKVAVYCRDEDDDDDGDVADLDDDAVTRRGRQRDLYMQGPGVMQCIRTNGVDEYDLILPFKFVRDVDSGAITGVSFADPHGIVVSFRTEKDATGKVTAQTIDRTDSASSRQEPEFRIPYTIQRSADGSSVVAVVFVGDDKDEELTIPLRYIMNDDGSRVVGVSFVDDDDDQHHRKVDWRGLDAGLVGIAFLIGFLAGFGLYLTNRKRRGGNPRRRRRRRNDDDSQSSLKGDAATTTDFDDAETIPVI
jgi:hypothetical protein